MRKKGFTLIELLAVIVVLAIIALIATPMVLNTIEKARKGAAESSANTYLKAIETYIVRAELDSSKPKLQAGVEYQLSSTNYEVASLADPETTFINDLVEVKGDKPESGYVIVNTDGTVEKIEMIMNNYPVMCTEEKCNVVEKEYESYEVADEVTIDGVGYHVIKSSSKYDKYVTLLRDESIGNFVFDENGGTDYETSTIKTYLNGTYKETFGDNKSYIKEITLLDFGNYTYHENQTLGVLLDSPEGTMVYLYQNYRDTFFEGFIDNWWNSGNLFSPNDTLTKTINGPRVAYSISPATNAMGESGYCIPGVNTDGSDRNDMICGLGATAGGNPGDIKIPVRPVIVISKEALD